MFPESSDAGTGKKEKEKKNRKGKDKENGSVSNTETPPPQSAQPEELNPPNVAVSRWGFFECMKCLYSGHTSQHVLKATCWNIK